MSVKVMRACKVRAYPNKQQIRQIQQTFGCCRYIWNYMLGRNQKAYARRKEPAMSRYDMNYLLTSLKQWKPWLSEADATALTSVTRSLAEAYQRFFCSGSGSPKWKSRKHPVQSYTSTSAGIQVLDDKHVRLPKLGSVRIRDGRKLSLLPRIKSATLSKDASGRYFVSLQYETDCPDIQIPPSGFTGVDMGLKHFLVQDNGTTVPNPRFLQQAEDKLKCTQRALSRKQKGSARYQKCKQSLARKHRKITDVRSDFQHKTANHIIRESQAVCVETLSVKELLQEKKLSKQISDASWSTFLFFLQYKSQDAGIPFVQTGRFYPSSQYCCRCGFRNQELKHLAVRQWRCPICGTDHDRDINAARNIKSEGMRLLYSQP